MFSLSDCCNQIKCIVRFSAAIYASVLFTIAIGSVVDPENKAVRDLLFLASCVFAFSSFVMYFRALHSEQSTLATVLPECMADEKQMEIVGSGDVPHYEEGMVDHEHGVIEMGEQVDTVLHPLLKRLMAVTAMLIGGLSSVYRGAISSLLLTPRLGLTGLLEACCGICLTLVFTLAKIPYFTGKTITDDERVLFPTRVVSSFSSALIAWGLVPKLSMIMRFITQCVISTSVFLVEYHSGKRRVHGCDRIPFWENALIFVVSVFYSCVATPEDVSPFSELTACNVFFYSASCVALSYVFIPYYRFSAEIPASRPIAPELELVPPPRLTPI